MSASRAAAADPRRGLLRRPALRQDDARRAALPPRGRRRDPRLDAGRRETSRACRSSPTSPRRCRSRRRSRSSASRRRAAGSRRPGGRSSATASRNGIGIENGLHQFLRDDPELAPLARASGATLTDLRRPPADLDVPSGANLEVPGKIVLTVGSDCAIGKMTVSLELDREARARGIASEVRPDRARPGSRSPAGASRSMPSSPTSSPARPSGSSSRAASVGESSSSSRARARSRIRPTRA